MRVWIDQELCTGDVICTEIVPDLFDMHSDGLAYVKEIGKAMLGSDGEPIYKSSKGLVDIPEHLLEATIETADQDCPGECIFIEMD
jgi:ferredoxin